MIVAARARRPTVGAPPQGAGPLAFIALTALLFVAHLNALQWQVVWFLQDLAGASALIGADRSGEVIAWAAVVVIAVRARRPALGRLRTRDAPLGSSTTLIVAAAAFVSVHGAVTIMGDGASLAPLRPLALLVVLVVVAPLGVRTIAPAFLAAAAVGIVGSLAVALAGWERAFRLDMESRLPGPALFGPERLQGFYPHPNNAGAFAVLVIVIALALRASRTTGRRVGAGLVVLAAVALLVLSASDSLTAAFALGAALAARAVAPLLQRVPRRSRIGLALFGGLALTAVPFVLAQRLGASALTGRVHVWQEVLAMLDAADRWAGVGPEPLLRESPFRGRLTLFWSAGDAHSTVIEMLLVAGVTGLLVTGLVYAALLLVALETLEVSHGWSLAVATVPLVLGVAEVMFVHGPADGRDVFLVVVGLLLAWKHAARDHAARAHADSADTLARDASSSAAAGGAAAGST